MRHRRATTEEPQQSAQSPSSAPPPSCRAPPSSRRHRSSARRPCLAVRRRIAARCASSLRPVVFSIHADDLVRADVDAAAAARLAAARQPRDTTPMSAAPCAGVDVDRAAGVAEARVDAVAAGGELAVGRDRRLRTPGPACTSASSTGIMRLVQLVLSPVPAFVVRPKPTTRTLRARDELLRRAGARDRARLGRRRVVEHEHADVVLVLPVGYAVARLDLDRHRRRAASRSTRADDHLDGWVVDAVPGGEHDVGRDQRAGAQRVGREHARRRRATRPPARWCRRRRAR